MATVGYLISIITSESDVNVTLAVLNTAGRGKAFYGVSNEITNTNLWIIPKAKKGIQEVVTQLQAIPSVRNVSIVALSMLVSKNELPEVRALFADLGWDASDVTDDMLSLFINAKLQGLYTYYIDHGHTRQGAVKIKIKPIEEHSHFSPDWLKSPGFDIDKPQEEELTIDNMEIRSFYSETIIKEEDDPPPPQQEGEE